MLQVALKCADQKILYITGEESDQQIRMRAERLGIINDNCFILTETNTQAIFQHLESLRPGIIIADSIHRIREQVGTDRVLLGLSGGVDSSVVGAFPR